MERLCEKYKYLNSNKGYNTAKFSVDDVLRSTNETDPEADLTLRIGIDSMLSPPFFLTLKAKT